MVDMGLNFSDNTEKRRNLWEHLRKYTVRILSV